MMFEYRTNPGLPRLAWGAVVSKDSESAIVYHGKQVEIRSEGFVEGAWNGSFSELPSAEISVVCGTGGAVRAGCLEFWSGTDRIFPIYSIAKAGTLFVSNSIIFSLVLAGEEPDQSYPFYYDDFIRVVRTGRSTRYGLRTAAGARVRLDFDCIVKVAPDLRLSTTRFSNGGTFHDYQSYYDLLASSVEGVLKNSMSEQRRFPYDPVAACSGGYDANAGAALSAKAGCRHAMTFSGMHRGGRYSDSGRQVADALGLTCLERDPGRFRDARDLSEFCITPHAMSCPYAAFEDFLPDKILVTGNHGDVVWGMEKAGLMSDGRVVWARFVSGYGLSEYRLRLGFLVFSPCRIGSTHSAEIAKIMYSDEMAPWRIRGSYDKPLPRRILEESGVPRETFGTKKMASAQVRFDGRPVQSTHIGADYARFMSRRRANVNIPVDPYWRFRKHLRALLLLHLSPRNRRFVPETPIERTLGFLGNRIHVFDWYYAFNLQYCFEALKSRYRVMDT